MKVLVTRAEPAATRTASLLEAKGHEAIKFPLFDIQDTGASVPDEHFDGFIFTSSNACMILAKRRWRSDSPDKPAFCVGEKTAKEAAALGFREVSYEHGGAASLAPTIIAANLPDNAKLLYFTTPDRSFNLEQHLAPHKIQVTNLEIYKAVISSRQPRDLRDLWELNLPEIVLTYSRRSSEVLEKTIKQAGLEKALVNTRLVAISEYSVGSLGMLNWDEIAWPPVANEEAMLHIFDNNRA